MRWKVYYGDGSTFSDIDGPATEAPKFNVQAIVFADPMVGRQVWHGAFGMGDYYWPEGDPHDVETPWGRGDIASLITYLSEPGCKAVFIGRMVSNEAWEDIWHQAATDPDFPRKTGLRREEPASPPGVTF